MQSEVSGIENYIQSLQCPPLPSIRQSRGMAHPFPKSVCDTVRSTDEYNAQGR